MKSLLITFIIGLAGAFGLPSFARSRKGLAANIAEGTHDASVNKTTDAAMSTRHLLAKVGTDIDHIDICAAANRPLGTVPDEPASGDLAAVHLLGKGPTKKMVASGAITAGATVFTDAGGKVQAEPAAAGTFYQVGRALNAASADGDIVEVQDCSPVLLTVIDGTAVTTVANIKTSLATAGYVKFI
jgi:hypothetical protein